MLLVYARECAECKLAKQLKMVNAFARQNGLRVRVKRTLVDRKVADEAAQLTDVPLPYVWNEDTRTALHLLDMTEADLQHLL